MEPATPPRSPRRLAVLSDRDAMPEAGDSEFRFRDPPSVEPQAQALERQIVALIARAPGLPAKLPVGDLSLQSVRVGASSISLVLGAQSPLASFDVDWPANAASARVGLRFEPRVTNLGHFEPVLTRLAERLARALTRPQWEGAWTAARALRDLPRGIPLTFFRQRVAGVEPAVGLVRTGFNCNQDCGVCWQDRLWGRYDADTVLRWIEDLYEQGARTLLLSGGEPTLDPRLPDYLRHARALGYTECTLETNAIQLARGDLAMTLRDAGLSIAFVSLHSPDAATSDAITRAPGTFERTCEGIEALIRAQVPVRINAVMSAEGLATLGALPDFVANRFGPAGGVMGLVLSYPTLPYRGELTASIMPPPVPLRAALQTTIARARARGLALQGLHGPCGPTVCALGEDLDEGVLHPVTSVSFRTHGAPCEQCAARPYCLGVRHEELQLFGEACMTPLREVPPHAVAVPPAG